MTGRKAALAGAGIYLIRDEMGQKIMLPRCVARVGERDVADSQVVICTEDAHAVT